MQLPRVMWALEAVATFLIDSASWGHYSNINTKIIIEKVKKYIEEVMMCLFTYNHPDTQDQQVERLSLLG